MVPMWKLSPYIWCFGCVVLLTVSCAGPGPDGLRTTPNGEGPQVVWDLEALPLPTIPFPNDFATRVDAMSPTGRRLNVSMVAPTDVETTLREMPGRSRGSAGVSNLERVSLVCFKRAVELYQRPTSR